MSKILSLRILVSLIVLNIMLFLFFLIAPYYFLGAQYYIPKANPVWGFIMPNSLEAWFFFGLAFVFLAFWVVSVMILIWKRPDIAQKGIHPIY